MKVVFYQSKDELLSINLLFNIIRQSLPVSTRYSTTYFTYNGASFLARMYDVVAVILKRGKSTIHHVIGDFNYATLLLPKTKTILTIHDLYRLYINEGNPLKLFLVKWSWLKLPVAKAAVVTVVSHCTRKEVLKYLACDPGNLRVIYNCISPDFKPSPKIFNKQKPVLLQVGTRANKNLERLAHAIKGLECKLEIIGKPDQQTISLLDNFNIDYNWSGNLSQQQVIQKYLDCDMVVFVSTYEGFGMPIIEANTIERAVVTGNVSAMPEIAGDAACLVDPMNIESIRDGINRVIQNDAYRAQLIDAGKLNRNRFLAANIANQYAALYEEVYEKSKA